jgi:hypothetical protein
MFLKLEMNCTVHSVAPSWYSKSVPSELRNGALRFNRILWKLGTDDVLKTRDLLNGPGVRPVW